MVLASQLLKVFVWVCIVKKHMHCIFMYFSFSCKVANIITITKAQSKQGNVTLEAKAQRPK